MRKAAVNASAAPELPRKWASARWRTSPTIRLSRMPRRDHAPAAAGGTSGRSGGAARRQGWPRRGVLDQALEEGVLLLSPSTARVRSSISLSRSSTRLARSATGGGAASGPSTRRASARPNGESRTMLRIGSIMRHEEDQTEECHGNDLTRSGAPPFKGGGVPGDHFGEERREDSMAVPGQERGHGEDPLLRTAARAAPRSRARSIWAGSVSCRRLRCCTSFFSASCSPCSARPLQARDRPLQRRIDVDRGAPRARRTPPRCSPGARSSAAIASSGQLLPRHPGLEPRPRARAAPPATRRTWPAPGPPSAPRAGRTSAAPAAGGETPRCAYAGGGQGEVAQLAGPGHVRHRRQDASLDHRAQQHVAARSDPAPGERGRGVPRACSARRRAGSRSRRRSRTSRSRPFASLEHDEGGSVTHRRRRVPARRAPAPPRAARAAASRPLASSSARRERRGAARWPSAHDGSRRGRARRGERAARRARRAAGRRDGRLRAVVRPQPLEHLGMPARAGEIGRQLRPARRRSRRRAARGTSAGMGGVGRPLAEASRRAGSRPAASQAA